MAIPKSKKFNLNNFLYFFALLYAKSRTAMNKIRLLIKDIRPSRIDLFYDILLVCENSNKVLNISIGKAEAESMAICLDEIKAPRPLTYDVFCNIMQEYSLLLKEVVITNFLDGNYYAKAVFIDGDGNEKSFDMRPSDAFNLALRYACPIYATEKVIEEVGFDYQSYCEDIAHQTEEDEERYIRENLSSFGINMLKDLLQCAVENEDYKTASILRDRIKLLEAENDEHNDK